MLPEDSYTVQPSEDSRWSCRNDTLKISVSMKTDKADTEANARAKMLIYLLENKLQ